MPDLPAGPETRLLHAQHVWARGQAQQVILPALIGARGELRLRVLFLGGDLRARDRKSRGSRMAPNSSALPA